VRRQLRLPKKSDHPIVDDNLTHLYHLPVIGSFFKKRLTMSLDMIGHKRYSNLLEIGFGSGVMLQELSKMADEVHACDIHSHIDKVEAMTKRENLNIQYCQGSITDLPYEDQSFDGVISVACIEHIKELSKAVSEMKRVLVPGGTLVLGFPIETKITDVLLTLAGSQKAYKQKLREIHPNSHADILREVKRQFGDYQTRKLPSFFPESIALYYSCLATKRDGLV